MNVSLGVGELISFGWTLFKKRPWFFISSLVFVFLIALFCGIVIGLVDVATGSFGNTVNYAMATLIAPVAQSLVHNILFYILMIFAGIGFISFALKAHDSVELVRVVDFWNPQVFWNYVLTTIATRFIVTAGYLLFIIPGIIFSIMFVFATYLVVDKGLTPISALKESYRITKGRLWHIFVFQLATVCLNIVGALALGMGLLVTIPITKFATVHLYRNLSSTAPEVSSMHDISRKLWTGVVIGGLVSVAILIVTEIRVIGRSAMTYEKRSQMVVAAINRRSIQLELSLYEDHHKKYPSDMHELEVNWLPLLGQTAAPKVPDIAQYQYIPSADGLHFTLCTELAMPASQAACVSDQDHPAGYDFSQNSPVVR